ncbi:hypothetical protein H5410_040626 [Solanum commersonii]|uniref:Uncharacterized protein n=1 Tax=Solanum commersonii TaxID=4109 RepID=A0A9J5XSI0_SOLCO|nr:hypothetical protein H5410_040626 [Solanum commersonii]
MIIPIKCLAIYILEQVVVPLDLSLLVWTVRNIRIEQVQFQYIAGSTSSEEIEIFVNYNIKKKN